MNRDQPEVTLIDWLREISQDDFSWLVPSSEDENITGWQTDELVAAKELEKKIKRLSKELISKKSISEYKNDIRLSNKEDIFSSNKKDIFELQFSSFSDLSELLRSLCGKNSGVFKDGEGDNLFIFHRKLTDDYINYQFQYSAEKLAEKFKKKIGFLRMSGIGLCVILTGTVILAIFTIPSKRVSSPSVAP